jgi:thiosulfate/3-mercaptopyruvate sulfurtransferase
MNAGFGQFCRGYFILSFLAYPRIKVLHGGIAAWMSQGRPLSTAEKTPAMKTFPIDANVADIMIDAKTMLSAVGNEAIVKLDAQDVDEWAGTSSSPYGKDFIPGARWLEWHRMMKPIPEGPKAPEGILVECATIGVTPEKPVYLYCFKGARASDTYLGLKEAGVRAHLLRVLE